MLHKVPAVNQTSEYYQDKVVVVTGGASGIGLALAETLLSYGTKQIVLVDFNDEKLNRETVRLNSVYPGRVLGVRCNVKKEEEVQRMIQKAEEFGGRIDILFNDAGTDLGGPFDKQRNEDWEKAFALNFYGALYGIRAVLPIMRKQGGGHIVNTISGIAFAPMACQTMYSATKAALNELTLALRYELWDENIRMTSATSQDESKGKVPSLRLGPRFRWRRPSFLHSSGDRKSPQLSPGTTRTLPVSPPPPYESSL